MKRKGWPVLPLGEVCQVNPRIGAEAPTPETLVSFVPMAAVDEQRGVIAEQETRAYREVAKGYTYFRDNDVLFAKITPCMENGKAAIAHGLTNGIGFGSTEFHVLRPNATVLPEWIFAFIRQPSFRVVAKANFTGTAGQQRVPTDFMKTVAIPLPPLDEQHRIVRILDEAEDLRQLRARADERMAEFISALFNQMFVKKLDSFDQVSLEEVASDRPYALSSGPFGSNLTSAHYVSEGVIVLRGTNVTSGQLSLENLKFISEGKALELARSAVVPGDIVVVAVGSSGLALEIPENLPRAIMSQNFNKITPDTKKIHPTFLEVCLNSPFVQQQLHQEITDTVRTFLSLTKLKKVNIPLPPLSLQRDFAARVAEARALQDQQARSRSRLEAGFQALLHQAFGGEL